MPIGFKLPFSVSTGSIGHFAMTEDIIDAVRQDIKSLLITNWGERAMRFNMGANFKEFLFEQRTDDLRVSIADRVESQISLWLPFVKIETLNIMFSDDSPEIQENAIGIFIRFRLTDRPDITSSITFVTGQ